MSKKIKSDPIKLNDSYNADEKTNQLSDGASTNESVKKSDPTANNQLVSKVQKPDAQSSEPTSSTSFSKVKVTQIGSSIGRKRDQEKTLIGLGLGKIGKSRIIENSPSVNGMINKVKHLITTEIA